MSRLSTAVRRVIAHRHSVPPRAAGYFEDKLDGVGDILRRAQGATVLDIGCNNGLAGFQFAQNGAALVHGVDQHEPGIIAARQLFSELPALSRFEVVDLKQGPRSLAKAFGTDYKRRYDVVLFLAVWQQLLARMARAELDRLVTHLAKRTGRYFLIRNYRRHIDEVRPLLEAEGLEMIHFSELSDVSGPKAIFRRR